MEIRDPVVRAELERSPADEISILDVGAGPLTWLGYRYSGKKLTIVPVDPLAAEYDRLLHEAGLEPPVRTIPVAGEELLEHFDPGALTSPTHPTRSTTAPTRSRSSRTWSRLCAPEVP
jgi:hypothetical protein